MRSIAVIPARGGSQRIPRKNIKLFHGKPIVGHVIEAARLSKWFDRIVVSTDTQAIADIALSHGAEVPFLRSAPTADDHAPIALPVVETLSRLASEGENFDTVCCLLPTAAFVTPALIRRGGDALLAGGYDAMVTVQAYSAPVERGLQIDDKGRLAMRWPEYRPVRTQDLQPTYHDAGQMYWARADALMAHGRFLTDNVGALELGRLDVMDIDEPGDWAVAERLWACRCNESDVA